MSAIDTPPQSTPFPWYALQIRSKQRKGISAMVCGKGYETYEPLYRSRRRWSDRVKQVDFPLFPGYIFCRLDLRNRLPILMVPGVVSIVGLGKTPVPVDEEEIETLRAIVDSGLPAEPWPFLGLGSKVYIERGPLAGVEGIITDMNKVYRLVVSVSLLQRSVGVEIDRNWARPISVGMGPRGVTLAELRLRDPESPLPPESAARRTETSCDF
jgi:transcription antitermination factor NusG